MEVVPIEIIADADPVDSARGDDTSRTAWEHSDLAHVRIKVLRGHKDAVKTCQFCDGESKILTASYDHTVALWDVESGQQRQSYADCHSSKICAARATPDGTRFVSCGWDKHVVMCDMERGAALWRHRHDGIVTCCNVSHDGSMAVTGSDLDHTVKIWDVKTGAVITAIDDLHTSTVTSCMFSPQDDRIVTTSMDRTTRFYDLKTNCNTITLRGHINVISDACMTADEQRLATVSYDRAIKLWDITTGGFRSKGPDMFEKAHEGCISSCAFSGDGVCLATGGYDRQVCVWNLEHHVQTLRLQGHADAVEDVCFSPDMTWVLSCSKDRTVRLWNVEHSDDLPQVMESKKTAGAKTYTCGECRKPFSVTKVDGADDIKLCVFCRLQKPDRNSDTFSL